MKTGELAKLLNGQTLVEGEDKEIPRFYIGDLLSFVMGRAGGGCCWLTIMSNVNVCAVAKLLECSAVVLCEGVQPEPAFLSRMTSENIMLVLTPLDLYSAAAKISGSAETC